MLKHNTLNRQKILTGFLWTALFAYLVIKPLRIGNDINVYLYASRQFFDLQNMYAENPYNQYLYSPFFTLIMWPLSILDLGLARVLWAFINLGLVIRLFKLLQQIPDGILKLEPKYKKWWSIGVVLLSLGYLNHNLILGQVTILILWLTLEGLYQIRQNKTISGSALLAIGISIKILPAIALGYLFLKGKFRSLAWITIITGFTLIIPAIVVGFEHNLFLHRQWQAKINPAGEKFAFENNDGCQSLNSVIPAYFYDFGAEEPQFHGLPRKIATVPYSTLSIILQASRLILLFSVLWVVFYRWKRRRNEYLYFFWEVAYLMLVSFLIFPHQMKYSMLYIVPAGAFILFYLLYFLNREFSLKSSEKMMIGAGFLQLFLLAFTGRDVVGDFVADFLDYYRFMGLNVLLLIGMMAYFNPYRLESKLAQANAVPDEKQRQLVPEELYLKQIARP